MSSWLRKGPPSRDETAEKKNSQLDAENLADLMNELAASTNSKNKKERQSSFSEEETDSTFVSITDEESEFSGSDVEVLPRLKSKDSTLLAPTVNGSRSNSLKSKSASNTPSSSSKIPYVSTSQKLNSWWGRSTPTKTGQTSGGGSDDVQQLMKRIKMLEEEQQLADNFKRSFKETMELQLQTTSTELELERDKVKRLEQELKSLKLQNELSGNTQREIIFDSGSKWASLLTKLEQKIDTEKKEFSKRTESRENYSKVFQKLEETKLRLINELKEETLFLQGLREEQMNMDPNAPENLKRDLSTKISKTEFNIKGLYEKMDAERKSLKTLEDDNKMDELLEQMILFHEDLVGSVSSAANESKKQDDHVESLTTQIRTLKAQLDITTEGLAKEKVLLGAKLNEEVKLLEEAQKDRDALKTELESAKQKIDNLESLKASEVARMTISLNELEKKLKLSEEEKQQSLVVIASEKQKYSEEVSKLKASFEDEKATIVQNHSEVQEKLQSQISSLQTEVKNEKLEKDAAIENGKVALESVKSNYEAEITKFTAKTEELEIQNKEAETKLVELKEELNKTITDLQVQIQTVNQNLVSETEKNKQLQALNETTQKKLEEEMEKVKEEQMRAETLEKKLEEQNEQILLLEARKKRLDTVVNSMKGMLNDLDS